MIGGKALCRGLVGLAAAAMLAGCGSTGASPAPSATPAQSGRSTPPAAADPQATVAPARAATAAPGLPSVAVRTAPGYGRLLVDGTGRTLYLFTADRGPTSACRGACAAAWPPLILHGSARSGDGVQGSRLTVVRRGGGERQLAYYGHPLYYYLGDREAGQINCQDVEEFGGHWWLVAPNGQQNRSTP